MTKKLLDKKLEAFKKHNNCFAIVSGAWLDEDKRQAWGSTDTCVYLRFKFSNGTVRTIHKDVVEHMQKRDFSPRWCDV